MNIAKFVFVLLFIFVKVVHFFLKPLPPQRYQTRRSTPRITINEDGASPGQKHRWDLHERLAKQFDAELQKLNGKPYFEFYSSKRHYGVFVEKQLGTHSIRVLSNWPSHSRLHVFNDGKKYREKYPGLKDVEIGDSRFDRKFVIHAESEQEAKRIVGHSVRKRILQHARNAHGRITIQIAGSQIEMGSNATRLLPRAQIAAIIKNLVAIHGLMLDSFGNSSVPVHDVIVDVNVTHDSNCMVCGSQFAKNIVYCRKCMTPHHKDCWNYIGQCSTYGCFSRRSMSTKN